MSVCFIGWMSGGIPSWVTQIIDQLYKINVYQLHIRGGRYRTRTEKIIDLEVPSLTNLIKHNLIQYTSIEPVFTLTQEKPSTWLTLGPDKLYQVNLYRVHLTSGEYWKHKSLWWHELIEWIDLNQVANDAEPRTVKPWAKDIIILVFRLLHSVIYPLF